MASMERSLRPWGHLNSELLYLIYSRLPDVVDFIRFRCVCKWWRSSCGCQPNDLCRPHQQLPWLMLPYHVDQAHRQFYNISTHSIHTIHLPEAQGQRIISSSNGCLLLLDPSSSGLSFLNPLTRHRISLPHLHNSDYISQCWCLDTVIVIVLLHHDDYFLYWRSDDDMDLRTWTSLRSGLQGRIRSVAFHKDQFYLMGANKTLSICPLRPTATKGTIIPSLCQPGHMFFPYLLTYAAHLFLVGYTQDSNIMYFKLEDAKDVANRWSKVTGLDGASSLYLTTEINNCTYVVHKCSRNSAFLFNLPSKQKKNGRKVQPIYMTTVDGGIQKIIKCLYQMSYCMGLAESVFLLLPSLS